MTCILNNNEEVWVKIVQGLECCVEVGFIF